MDAVTTSTGSGPVVLVRGLEWTDEELKGAIASHFRIVFAPSDDAYDATIDAFAAEVEAVVTNGSSGLSASQISRMPKLGFVHCRGAGTDNIDIDAARERGVVVSSGAGVNAFAVADQAMALLLGSVRSVVKLDAEARTGRFNQAMAAPLGTIHGRRLGILGLGSIGRLIAERGRGFGMEIGYHARSQREGCDYRYFTELEELARWCDFLAIAVPGGEETRHLVTRTVLEALGQEGHLVNVARGSVVDTEALIEALNGGQIAGAGLDVWEGEPTVDGRLAGAANLTLSPHVGGFASAAAAATYERTVGNLLDYFAGREVKYRLA